MKNGWQKKGFTVKVDDDTPRYIRYVVATCCMVLVHLPTKLGDFVRAHVGNILHMEQMGYHRRIH